MDVICNQKKELSRLQSEFICFKEYEKIVHKKVSKCKNSITDTVKLTILTTFKINDKETKREKLKLLLFQEQMEHKILTKKC